MLAAFGAASCFAVAARVAELLPAPPQEQPSPLTPRQRAVAERIVAGLGNAEIGRELELSVKTALPNPNMRLIVGEPGRARVIVMNKLMITTTSVLAGAALVLGGTLAANAATPTPTPTPTHTALSCSFGEHLISAWRDVSKDMRADLKKARAEAPGPTRRADLKAIETKALDGGYGAQTEARAKFLQSHKGELKGIRPLPADLKADLKTLHSDKGKTAKLAELNTIASKALAGGYGTKIETLAKDVQGSSAWQDCTAAVTGS